MASTSQAEAARRAERARAVGLFRYGLVRQAADASLSSRERGRLVRELADAVHAGPDGRPVQVSRKTLDRWIRAWRAGGFDALVPAPRRVEARTPAEVLELAAALKRENPARTAAQVGRILRASSGWAPSDRTLQRHFEALELNTRPDGSAPVAFGRFEAGRPNEIWTGDALHGPKIDGRKTYLFAFIDGHSRALVGYRFGYAEDTVRLAAALRAALASRGVPDTVYVDNGSAFVDAALRRACAVLGIRLTHSAPGRPEGRGKIERVFETVRGEFLVEIAPVGGHVVADLAALNTAFTAWVETVYHRRVHTETGLAPLARFEAGGPFTYPSDAALTEAFKWEDHRKVRKTATISLHGNTYQVEPHLVGRTVAAVYDPFDLSSIEIRWQDRPAGTAIPTVIGRHAHPKARPETPPTARPAATGIDYIDLLTAAHDTELAATTISYAAATGPAGDQDTP
ncbi:DDE-type integrase/transposase/recombinase [Pseudofrankia sp. BMG5.37]|uniref:DDE-type integrase/transposase/recombinase n=1 Tax=Pseudofrankia sp. BMG5.37 TaxID=3050035 RepID=UPI002893FB66|nr:DDE-type integrase/transposase/recombinase [Pseudofrankia sp. BMG5.37]MDT3446941.1 DDE-type integrase/transposase/recombinase [Pseudofrankia sp. BMG5.37]